MEYKHINDCWEAIRNAKTIGEVEDLFEEFPRWSGDWCVTKQDGVVTVHNSYWDSQCDTWEEDEEDIDIEYSED